MRFTPMKLAASILTLIALLVGSPGGAEAQAGTGIVRGRVIEAGSGRAVSDVQLYVDGSQRVAITSANGSYALSGVPAGHHTLHAKLIGFAPASRDVDVTAAGTTVADF